MRNRTKPICDVETGRRIPTVCNIGNIAYQVKRPLKLDPKKEKFKDDTEANVFSGRPMLNEWAIKI